MKSIKEKSEEYAREFVEPFVLYYTKDEVRQFEAQHEDSFIEGANYALNKIEFVIGLDSNAVVSLKAVKECIEQLKK